MDYEFINSFLANHGILMEMFLQDMVRMCGAVAFFGGIFLGYLITETKGGVTWKDALWYDGKKWCVIESPRESKEGTMIEDKNIKDSSIHPARFTYRQIDFIKHLLVEFDEVFEDEAEDFCKTIMGAE